MAQYVDEERKDPPVEIAGYFITPVCQVRISATNFGGRIAVIGSKTPLALIVNSGDKEWIVSVPEPGDSPPG